MTALFCNYCDWHGTRKDLSAMRGCAVCPNCSNSPVRTEKRYLAIKAKLTNEPAPSASPEHTDVKKRFTKLQREMLDIRESEEIESMKRSVKTHQEGLDRKKRIETEHENELEFMRRESRDNPIAVLLPYVGRNDSAPKTETERMMDGIEDPDPERKGIWVEKEPRVRWLGAI